MEESEPDSQKTTEQSDYPSEDQGPPAQEEAPGVRREPVTELGHDLTESDCANPEAVTTPVSDNTIGAGDDSLRGSKDPPGEDGSKETSDEPPSQPTPGEGGCRENITKPKKKPPLFRTKVSNDNMNESILRLTRQASQEEPPPAADRPLGRRKSNGSRNKFLLRGQQVSDDSSPPATPDIAIHIQQSDPPVVCRFPHQHSGEGPSLTTYLKQSSYEARSEPALSREPSQEKEFTDSKGVNLQQFIIDTLRKPQDRTMLLYLEKELVDLVNSCALEKKFGPMSSYHRMIVHRVAAYFGLDHNVDQSGKTVVVEKTRDTRIPEKRFKEHIQDEKMEGPARTILRRDTAGHDESYDYHSDRSDLYSRDDKKSKSFEERQEQYDKARARIFKHSGQEALTVDSPTRPRAILQLGSRQSSGASDDSSYWKQERPWSSVDSSGSDRPTVPVITKASSFGGSSRSSNLLMRVDSGGSSQSTGSPSSGSIASSSSGSKLQECQEGSVSSSSSVSTIPHRGVTLQPSSSCLQSMPGPVLGSDSSTQLPPGTGVSWSGTVSPSPSQFCMAPIPAGGQGRITPSQQPVLFIAPNLESVPPGCIIINPHTGQPYLNQDGTPLVYQPVAPQPQSSVGQLSAHTGQQPQQPQHVATSQSCQQHSIAYPPQSTQEGHLMTAGPPQMVHYGTRPPSTQPVPPIQMTPISSGDYQELQGQFVNLGLVHHSQQEGPEGPSHHIQVPHGAPTPQHQPAPQPVSHGMLQPMKGPITKGHNVSQPYSTVQQPQQISGHFAAQLSVPEGQAGSRYHHIPGGTTVPQFCTPMLQPQQIGIHPQPQGMTPVYYPAPHSASHLPAHPEGHHADSQGKPQTLYAPGYQGGIPAGTQQTQQIVYVSDKPYEHQFVEHQPGAPGIHGTFIASSQPHGGGSGVAGQLSASSSRDAIRPTSPTAQTIPVGYPLPQLHHVVPHQSYHTMVQLPRPASQGPPVGIANYQVIPAPGVHGSSPGQVRPQSQPAPAALVQQPQQQHQLGQVVQSEGPAQRKEAWGPPPPATYQPIPQYRHCITEQGSEEVLEVCQLPRDLPCHAVLPLLEGIAQFGAKICWVPRTPQATPSTQQGGPPPSTKPVSDFTILAIFPTPELAQKAIFNSASAKYSLQPPEKSYFPIILGE